jgi:prephenate dehydrogenase
MLATMFNRITIVGLGLIGGSIALALRAHGVRSYLVAYDTSAESLEKALHLGYIDAVAPTLIEAIKESDLIIICSPLSTYPSIAAIVKKHALPDVIVTDVGSVKNCAVEDFITLSECFVPAHPIAGKAVSGLDNADPHLFSGKKIILTPTPQTSIHGLRRITRFWQSLGGYTEEMQVAKHDSLYAAISHLPQALLFCEAKALKVIPDIPALQQHLRIAHSSPTMWADIFIGNHLPLIPLLEQTIQRIPLLTTIDIERAKQARQALNDSVIAVGQLPAVSYLIASILVELCPNIAYAGGGFTDTTACLLHYKNLPTTPDGKLTNFLLELHQLVRLIRQQDRKALQAYLAS